MTLAWLLGFACILFAAADDFDALAARAIAAREAGKAAEAAALYRQALELKPAWAEGWWYLGMAAYDADAFPACRQAFGKFLELQPKSAPAAALLGLCEYETGAYREALGHLSGARAAAGGLPPEVEQVARFHHGILLTTAGRFDEATRVLKPLIPKAAGNAALTTAIGLNALQLELLPKDVPDALRPAVAAAGETASLWVSGDAARTAAAFRDLLAGFPAAPGVHAFYATYLLAEPRPPDAIRELHAELDLNPRNARARALLALVLDKLGQFAEALPPAAQAAKDAPDLPRAQFAYGLVLLDTGETAQAIPHLEAAERADPGQLDAHTALARAYSKAGRYDDSRRERRASIELARSPDAR
jgi:tetratricopeptide (TPR) repeat protein